MKKCSIPGCHRNYDRNGYCSTHHRRLELFGDPLGGPPIRTSPGVAAEFLRTVVLNHDTDECLPWPYAKNSAGYGHMSINGRNKLITRLVCEAKYGPASKGMEAAHSCGNGHLGCVAPRHLRWASHYENKADEIAHGTRQRGTRCHMAKLNEDQVREIKRSTEHRSILAQRYGVTASNISQIRLGRSWAWLEVGAEHGVRFSASDAEIAA